MNIPKILSLIRPNDQWTLRGTTLDDLDWHSATPKPTQDELDAGQIQLDNLAYRELRASAYPPLGDGLDALVHKENGDPSIWIAYIAACNAVKNKFPKS